MEKSKISGDCLSLMSTLTIVLKSKFYGTFFCNTPSKRIKQPIENSNDHGLRLL